MPFVFSSDTFSTEDPEETGETGVEAVPAIIFRVLTRGMVLVARQVFMEISFGKWKNKLTSPMRACVCRIHDRILKQANGVAILKHINQPNELKTTLQEGKKF